MSINWRWIRSVVWGVKFGLEAGWPWRTVWITAKYWADQDEEPNDGPPSGRDSDPIREPWGPAK